jgi:hypothetical protein
MPLDARQALEAARGALAADRTIDIVTTGARTGLRRTTEIWFTNIRGRILICGTPGRRGWLANLLAHPDFEFHFKESLTLALPARATPVRDPAARRRVMSAPETSWYRHQGCSLDELVDASPIVDVEFLGDFEALNRRR